MEDARERQRRTGLSRDVCERGETEKMERRGRWRERESPFEMRRKRRAKRIRIKASKKKLKPAGPQIVTDRENVHVPSAQSALMLNNRSIDRFSQKTHLLIESEYIHTPPPSFFFG
jgi:hypothetical protein